MFNFGGESDQKYDVEERSEQNFNFGFEKEADKEIEIKPDTP